jgi:hypothetical protein
LKLLIIMLAVLIVPVLLWTLRLNLIGKSTGQSSVKSYLTITAKQLPLWKRIMAYVAVWVLGSLMIVGLLALIFEEELLLRLLGSVMAIISWFLAHRIAKRVWRRKESNSGV